MSDITALHDQVSALFLSKLNVEVPSLDTDLLETGLLDSLVLVNMLMSLEQEFGLKISTDNLELDNLRSVANIAEYLVSQNGFQ